MNKFREYIKLSYDELMNKVSWPSWEDLQESTIIVMIASMIIALVIGVIDLAHWAYFTSCSKAKIES
jgi:preprotein translocase subunit SecE